jgi:hypothetical protein
MVPITMSFTMPFMNIVEQLTVILHEITLAGLDAVCKHDQMHGFTMVHATLCASEPPTYCFLALCVAYLIAT